MAKMYVLSRVDFEYNDEIYRMTENEGGKPLVVFFDRVKAEAECQKRNIQEIKKVEWSSYAYGFDDLFHYGKNEERKAVAEMLGIVDMEDEEIFNHMTAMIPSLSQEQLIVLSNLLSVTFFKVDEVTTGD